MAKKFTIAFFETEPWEREYLEGRLGRKYNLIFSSGELTRNKARKNPEINILSTFIYSSINSKILDIFKRLEFIATRSTGFDHIDTKECAKRNIIVSNVPTYGENTVAEHTFALILALSRKLYPSIQRAKSGDFSLDSLRGFDLKGKTLGVVGTGHIGRHTIRIAKGFEMKVLAFDVNRDLEFAKNAGFRYVSLKYLFGHSDIITLHIPYNKATHHLINLGNIKFFKKGCYLINTSRGGICDTTALLKGLEKGIFGGLGLDVLEEERFIKEEAELLSRSFKKMYDLKTALENHILLTQPNVIITPHNAFNSKEALTRILETTVDNIKSFIKGRPVNLVNKK